MKNSMRASRRGRAGLALAAGILLAVSAGLGGCAGDYGRLVFDQEANRSFESYQVLPDHQYYVTGPEGKPFAIIAIHRDYTLVPGLWREVEPTPAMLEKWVWGMNDGRMYYSAEKANGRVILDSAGKAVGVWYSKEDWTLVKNEDEVRIVIGAPHGPEFVPSTGRRSGREGR